MSDITMPLESAATHLPAKICPFCGNPVVGRRQKRFCSAVCRMAYFNQQHPRINRGPAGPREGTIKALILGYLADGAWHTEQEIADAIRAFAHSVGARISELRRANHPIESDAKRGDWTRAHRYRLVLPQAATADASSPITQEA